MDSARMRAHAMKAVAVAALVTFFAGPLAATPALAEDSGASSGVLAAPGIESGGDGSITLSWAAIEDAADYTIVEIGPADEGEIGAYALADPEQDHVVAIESRDELLRATVAPTPAAVRAFAVRGTDSDGVVIAQTASTGPVGADPETASADASGSDSAGAVESGSDSAEAEDTSADAPEAPSASTAWAGEDADTDVRTEIDLTGVVFDWGINNESHGGSYFGGCNFVSAGVAGDTTTARLWSADDGFYRPQEGNTTIVRPTSDGSGLIRPTWATKCVAPDGTSINGRTSASQTPNDTQSRVRITDGSGTVDPVANTAEISWEGSFTVAYYGGMTYWSATNPHLTIDEDGTGTVTATLSGYGTDMDDMSIWKPITGRTVTIAELSDVTVTETGFTADPDYLGIAIPTEIAGRNPQALKTPTNQSWWGAFPADFLSFQELTGQNSYWYTTDGGATTIQPRKVPLPITITVGATTPTPVTPTITTHPASITATTGTNAAFTVTATGHPLRYQWQTRTPDNTDWTDIADANSATYERTASLTDDGTQFRVIVSNDLGRVVSNPATLTVTADTDTGAVDPEPGDGDDTVEATGALFDWGLNDESNGGAYFGGCNFLSAGIAGDAGSARVWTASDGFYRAAQGNTTIVRPAADGGELAQQTWSTKCDTPDGTSVNGKTTSAADSHTGSRVRITGGEGVLDPAANTAEISWEGSFTVAYYGGMTYWSATDPRVVIEADGTGTVTATLSGYGADMDDASKWNPLTPRTVVLATLSGVTVTAAGFTRTPDYLGVSIPADIAGRNAQSAPTTENRAWWGAFPADFLRFQTLTGQSSYWFTTPGGAGTIQPRKVPLPLTICANAECAVPAPEPAAGADTVTISQRVVLAPTARLRAAAQQSPPRAQSATGAEHVIITRIVPAATDATGVEDRIIIAAIGLLVGLGLIVLLGGVGGGLVTMGVLDPRPASPRRPH